MDGKRIVLTYSQVKFLSSHRKPSKNKKSLDTAASENKRQRVPLR
jgi:hypothetical protein